MKNRWTPIAVVFVLALLGIALYFLTQSDVEDPKIAAGQPCTSDAGCLEGQACCEGLCKPSSQCSPDGTGPKGETPQKKADAGPKKAAKTLKDFKLPPKPRDPPITTDLAPGKCKKKTDCTGALMTCDEETNTCIEPFICLSDLDCSEGRFCQRGQCVDKIEGCRFIDCAPKGYCNTEFGACENYHCKSDADCLGGQHCDPETDTCVKCITDAHCPPQNKCMRSGYCLPPGGCQGDGDCDGDIRCDVRTSTCHTAPCVNDDLEPNDKWHLAKPLESGDYNLVACPGDKDWFKFEVKEGEGILAHAYADNNLMNIELSLHDVNGDEMHRAGDHRMEGEVSMVWPKVEKDTILYLKVRHTIGLGGPYELRFTIFGDGFCHEDEYEPNNSAGQATAIFQHIRTHFQLCPGNDDWILQSLEAGQTLQMLVGMVKGEVPRVEVFRDEEKAPMWKDDSSEPEKVLIYKSERAADYYIRISPLWPNSESRYDVRIDIKD